MPNLLVILISSFIAVLLVETLEFAIKKVVKMAKIGRPTDDPKKYQFRVRLTEKENLLLAETAQKLECSKSDVLIEGLHLVSESKKEK